MSWFKRDEVVAKTLQDNQILRKENANFREQNDKLQQRVDALKQKVKELLGKESDVEFVIDWSNPSIFCFERINGKSSVSLMSEEGGKLAIKDWYLYCSAEKHNELAKQYKNYIYTYKINLGD